MTRAKADLSLSALASGKAPKNAAFAFDPYWWKAAPRPAATAGLPAAVDVVIVGSGYTGLSAALTLLRHGRTVAVLDREAPGFGASTRNGGQVGSGNQKFRVKKLIQIRGEAKAVALLREGVAMLDYIGRLIETEGIDCHFERRGRFRGAMRPEHYDAMARDMDDLRRYAGVDSFPVQKSEQHREIGSDLFYGGSVLPGDAGLHPGLYHQGLLDRVTGAGGAVLGLTPATRIETLDRGFRVHTPRGQIAARDVIVATNGYTDHLEGYFRRRIVPVGSSIIATERMPRAVLDEAMPTRRMYGNTNRVFSYFRPAPDEDRIVWGGRSDYRHAGNSLAAYAHLARDLLKTFPHLGDVGVTHGWSGSIGFTFDEMPHLGKTPAGIHYAMGYCGTGVSRSTYFGNRIALQLLGNPEGRTAFDDIAFPSHPFHAVARNMVPVVQSWYRLRDLTRL